MRNRYTRWIAEGKAVIPTSQYWLRCVIEDHIQNAVNRLAAYEDIGTTPEQLKVIDQLYLEKCREVNFLRKQMAQCEKDIVLTPKCQVGDTVYYINHMGKLQENKVRSIQINISENKVGQIYKGDHLTFCDEDWEKVVFASVDAVHCHANNEPPKVDKTVIATMEVTQILKDVPKKSYVDKDSIHHGLAETVRKVIGNSDDLHINVQVFEGAEKNG